MDKMSFSYEALRWANVSEFVLELAFDFNLVCKIEKTKGFFMEKGLVVCKGEHSNLLEFKHRFESVVSKYNKD